MRQKGLLQRAATGHFMCADVFLGRSSSNLEVNWSSRLIFIKPIIFPIVYQPVWILLTESSSIINYLNDRSQSVFFKWVAGCLLDHGLVRDWAAVTTVLCSIQMYIYIFVDVVNCRVKSQNMYKSVDWFVMNITTYLKYWHLTLTTIISFLGKQGINFIDSPLLKLYICLSKSLIGTEGRTFQSNGM